MRTDLLKIAALLKHPKFSEETEWRLVKVVDPSSPEISFREGPSSLVPYVELPLPLASGALEVTQLRVGPTSSPELAEDAVKLLMRSNGINAEIQRSEIPYRGR